MELKLFKTTVLHLFTFDHRLVTSIHHKPNFFRAQLFCVRGFSHPCNCDTVQCRCSHCADHKAASWAWPPVHTLLPCLPSNTSCETREKAWKAWEQFNVAVLLVSSQNPRSSHKCTKACANKDLPPVSMHVHRHTNSLWKMLKRLTAWGRQILMPNLGGPVSCVQKDAVRWMFSIWIAGLPN